MKKIISQISLMILIIILVGISNFAPKVYAASLAGINCVSTVNEGDSFTVSLIYPSGYEITSAQANVTVTYSDNSKQSDVIVYMNREDMQSDQKAKFTAKAAGTAQISVTNILMVKTDGETVESDGSKTATLTVVGKTSGNNNTGNGSGSNTGNAGSSNSGSGNGTSSSGNGSNANGGAGSSNNGSSNSGTSNTGNPTPSGPKFTEVNETVYTTTKCNLRESYSTSSNKIATVESETKLIRKGIGDNGWSKCEYNGKVVYVSSQYLTQKAPTTNNDDKEKPVEKETEKVNFKDTNENLYAKQSCNLRASWSTDSEKVGYLEKGQAVERTGYAENGWSRILYNGKTVYVASRLLTVEKPEENQKTEENENIANTVDKEPSSSDNAIDSENVDPTQMTEEEILKEIESEIGVLPEVGINVANIAYVAVTIMAVCGLCAGIIYVVFIKNKEEDC